MDLARFANKYFNDQQPWVTIKDNPENALRHFMSAQVLKGLAVLMEPVLPFSARELWNMLNFFDPFENNHWDEAGKPTSLGHRLNKSKILFKNRR